MESWREQPVVFWTFLLPGALWLLGFFLVPLGLVWVLSFGERAGPIDILITWTLDNYARALDPLYLAIFWKSIWIAALATALTLAIGLPVALAVSFAPPRVKPLLLMLVILPFWTNLLIRTYAMIAVLRGNGYVNLGLGMLWQFASDAADLLAGQSLPPFTPLPLLYNNTAVVAGIVYVYLPFMVLPLYATLERLDRTFLEASLDLGASQWRTFFSIVVPLARPGIVSGIILVFIPALGTFLISDLLGGPDSQLIGNVIERQFKAANNWPLGSAMSFILMYLAFAVLALRAVLEQRRI
ncbi:MAG TPA: ABC transporter permease [Geminicoccaceae bacterium]|nr:ABC transporter permease [Geminicoccaceae bacterium]